MGEICEAQGCDKEIHAKGLCKTCYGRLWRTGSVDPQKKTSGKKDNDNEKLFSAERELEEAKEIYDCATGRAVVTWGIRVRDIKNEIFLLREKLGLGLVG